MIHKQFFDSQKQILQLPTQSFYIKIINATLIDNKKFIFKCYSVKSILLQ